MEAARSELVLGLEFVLAMELSWDWVLGYNMAKTSIGGLIDMKIKKMFFDWVVPVLFAVILSATIRTYVAEATSIPSESMLPTLQVGDHLIIDKITFKYTHLQRGDIIVFNPPAESGLDYRLIKRVIGLAGDTVYIKDGTVFINDSALPENYVTNKAVTDFGPYTVSEGSVFVMGDNRPNSFDSRYWGPVALDAVIGKAVARYFPLNRLALIHNP